MIDKKSIKKEESSTGGLGGPIQTPYAFSPKKKKINKATQTAKKQGFKVHKGMPKKSKIVDYKELWPNKKSSMNEQDSIASASDKDIESIIQKLTQDKDTVSVIDINTELPGLTPANLYKLLTKLSNRGILTTMTGVKIPSSYIDKLVDDRADIFSQAVSDTNLSENQIEVDVPDNIMSDLRSNGFDTLNDLFKRDKWNNRKNLSIETKQWLQSTLLPQMRNQNLQESIYKIVKKELLNEASYNQFKKNISYRSKSETLHKAIKEIKKKISDIDRIVEYTQRVKQELSEGEGVNYWNRTESQISQISEAISLLSNKIKELNKK